MYQKIMKRLESGWMGFLYIIWLFELALVLYDMVKTFASFNQDMGAGGICIKSSAVIAVICIYFSLRWLKRDILIALMIGVLPLIIYSYGVFQNIGGEIIWYGR